MKETGSNQSTQSSIWRSVTKYPAKFMLKTAITMNNAKADVAFLFIMPHHIATDEAKSAVNIIIG
jgi:hypothetical protein